MTALRRSQRSQPGFGDRLADWLDDVRSWVPGRFADQPRSGNAEELMRRAARCYARSGWSEDACRLYSALGDDRSAAPILEQLGRWSHAAAAYSRSGQWRQAARCWLEAAEPAEAAECLVQGDEPLEAAWLFAHRAGRVIRAQSLIAGLPDDAGHDVLEVEVVVARCDAGSSKPSQAARRLRAVAELLRTEAEAHLGSRAVDWGLELAADLRRPDLAAILHAIALQRGRPGARRRWAQWAECTLGTSAGIPEEETRADETPAPDEPSSSADGEAGSADDSGPRHDNRPEPEP